MQLAALVASGLFLTLLTFLGLWHARQIRSGQDFALAGRKLPLGVLVGTLVATWIGTGSIFGYAEKAYEYQASMFWLPIAGALGVLVLSVLAGRVREIPADTVPQVLGLRFGPAAQRIGAIALIAAYLIIVSYQYRAGAAVVGYITQSMATPSSQVWGVIGFGVFVILYTVLAGMVSVAWTDLINGILMTAGILLALGVLGYRAYTAEPNTLPIVTSLREPVPPITFIGWVGMLLPTFLLVLGDANLYQRFMSAESPTTARRAAVFMFFGILVLEWAIIGLACLGRLLLAEEPVNHGYTVIEIAFTLMPPWLGVMLIMSVLAVVVTTADSFLLGAATSVSTDFGSGLTSAKRQRVVVVILGLIAMGLAFTSDQFFAVAIYAYTLYGVTLTPAVVAALVAPSTPPVAVVAGMVSGLTIALLWKFLSFMDRLPELLANIDPVLPAIAVNLTLLLVVGLFISLSQKQQSGS